MAEEENKDDPFLFRLLRICLEQDRNDSSSPDELTDKELFSAFAFVIISMAILALTVGPFSLLK